MGDYKNITKSANLTNVDSFNTTYKAQFDKYKRIESLILNCILKGSNVTSDPLNWHLIELRLNNLREFINQVIFIEQLNNVLHSQIDNILNNKDLHILYGRNTKSANSINS